MAKRIVKLPDVGEGVAEAEVVEWAVAPGDTVREDQMLGAVMTDKATVEIPSPSDGRVVSLGAELGSTLAVGAEFIVLDVGVDSGDTPAAVAPPVAVAAAKSAPAAPSTSPPEPAVAAADSAPRAEPPSSTPPPPPPVATASDAAVAPGNRPRVLAAPAVRHRARALGVELADIAGSGVDGQILHADLDALIAGRGRSGGAEVVDVPLLGLRRQIAARMQKSKQTIPHFTYVEEVDVSELSRLREHLKSRAGEAPAPTLLPFIIKAIAVAIAEFPQMNARFNDEEGVISQYSDVHMGLATQTPAGLMVPVIRNAGALSVDALTSRIRELAAAARDGSADREDLSGSTITLSSLGALGGIVSTPVINYPEVAIIGVNKIVARAEIRNGAITERQVMNLSSSFDHRAVDGYDAAQFIQRIKSLLEHPATIFM